MRHSNAEAKEGHRFNSGCAQPPPPAPAPQPASAESPSRRPPDALAVLDSGTTFFTAPPRLFNEISRAVGPRIRVGGLGRIRPDSRWL